MYIKKVPCSDVQPRENDKAVTWNPCNAVHLRILLHVFRANPCIVEFWAGQCKSVQGGVRRSVQIRARGDPCKSVQWGLYAGHGQRCAVKAMAHDLAVS